jgi:curved DNA-binding protein CbpA
VSVAEKTLYDILEVSETASDEAIRAAYERLFNRLATDAERERPDSDASLRFIAVREAVLTLGDPQKRARYDRRLRTEWLAPQPAPFWKLSRAVPLLLCVALVASYLYHDRRQQQALLELQKAIAVERTREEAARTEVAAQQQVARDKAELCRLERLRYGKALSC